MTNETKEVIKKAPIAAITIDFDTYFKGVKDQSLIDHVKKEMAPIIDKVNEWRAKAAEIIVTDETHTEGMKAARLARLALVKVRTSTADKKDELKAESLVYSNGVQSVHNFIKGLIEPIEKELEGKEKFLEIKRANEVKELFETRSKEAETFKQFIPSVTWPKLGELTAADYDLVLTAAKNAKELKEKNELLHEERKNEIISFNKYGAVIILKDLHKYSAEEWTAIIDAKKKLYDAERQANIDSAAAKVEVPGPRPSIPVTPAAGAFPDDVAKPQMIEIKGTIFPPKQVVVANMNTAPKVMENNTAAAKPLQMDDNPSNDRRQMESILLQLESIKQMQFDEPAYQVLYKNVCTLLDKTINWTREKLNTI